MIKVLLADDHSIVLAGLRRLVEESADMEVVAEAADGREALERYDPQQIDLVILDIMLPHLDGFTVAERIRD